MRYQPFASCLYHTPWHQPAHAWHADAHESMSSWEEQGGDRLVEMRRSPRMEPLAKAKRPQVEAHPCRPDPAGAATSPRKAPVATSVRGGSGEHSAVAPERPPPRGRLRCGETEVIDAKTAMRTVTHALVRTYCREMPLAALYQAISLFHSTLRRLLSGIVRGLWRAGRDIVCSEGMRRFMERGTDTGQASIRALRDELDAVMDMTVLRRLVRCLPPYCSGLLHRGACKASPALVRT